MKNRTPKPTLALWCILLLLGLLSVGPAAVAQQNISMISVQVVNADGSPAPNVRVLIEADSCGRERPVFLQNATDSRGFVHDTVPAFRCNAPALYWVTMINCNNEPVRREVIIGRTPMPVVFTFCADDPNPRRCAAEFEFRPENGGFAFLNRSTFAPNTRPTFTWDFGDGGRSNEPNPMHAYRQPGTYQVCLTIMTQDSCTDTKCHEVVVRTTPEPCKAAFSMRPADNTGMSWTFVNESGGGNQRVLWTFGDGGRSDSPVSRTYRYERPGVYNVCLKVTWLNDSTNTIRCVDSVCQTITIGDPNPRRCAAEFEFRAENGGFAFLNRSTFAPDSRPMYTWDFGDGGRSNEPNPMHAYRQPGTYTVCLTIMTPDSCIDTKCHEVVVRATPEPCQASFTMRPVDNTGTTWTFVNESRGEYERVMWHFGDGGRSDDRTATHRYERPGTYTVCLIITGGQNDPTRPACFDSTCQTITIGDPNPKRCMAEFEIRPTNAGFAFLNRSTASPNSRLTFDWNFGDGDRSSDASPTHQYRQPGRYEVCLTISSSDSCTDTKCHVVEVPNNPGPCRAAFTAGPAPNSHDTWAFMNQSSGDYQRVLWSFGDGDRSEERNATHTYRRSGVYTVCLKIMSFNDSTNTVRCVDSTCQTITINIPQPPRCVADFEVRERNGGFQFINRSNSITAPNTRMDFVWDFGDGGRSTDVNPTHNYRRPGRYEVCLTIATADGCTNTKCRGVVVNGGPVDSIFTSICVRVLLSDARTPADSYQVLLFRRGPNNRYTSVDTAFGPGPDSTGLVCFEDLPQGEYIALAGLSANSQHRNAHVPTYFNRSLTWRTATIIDTRSNFSQTIDLVLLGRRLRNGPARAAGRAVTGSGKNSEETTAAGVIATDVETNEVAAYVETDAEGNYELTGLPYGTYRISAEMINRYDRPVVITLSESQPAAENVEVVLTTDPTSRSAFNTSGSDLTLYPNPTSGQLWIKASWTSAEPLNYTLMGTDGRVLRQWSAPAAEVIDITDLPQGLYLLRVVQGANAATRSFLRN